MMSMRNKLITIITMTLVFMLCVPIITAFAAGDNEHADVANGNEYADVTDENVYADVTDDNKYVDVTRYDGKRIGLVSGNIYNDKVYEIFRDPQVFYYKSTPDGITALKAGKIDAFLEDEPGVSYYVSQTKDVLCGTIDSEPNYMAFMAGKNERGEALVAEFNEYLAAVNESGELDKLQNKWFKGKEEDRTIEDYSNLPATKGEIIIATSPDYPPFEYMKDDMITGYEIELIMNFCRESGYRPDLRIVQWDGVLAGVNAGKYELGVSGFTITEERKQKVLFTDPVQVNRPGLATMRENNTGAVGFAEIKKGFEKTFISEARWKSFARGVYVTLKITVLSIIFGTILGFLVHLVCRKENRIAVRLSAVVRWLVQGMPEIVFLMIVYYIIFGKASMGGEAVAIFVFTIIFACTMHDLLEGGEENLDPGQKTAAMSLGYSDFKAFMRIILPQVARGFMPAYLTAVSTHIKATAVVGYIAVVDITKVGDIVRGATYEAFYPLIAVAILYFLMAGLLRLLIKLSTRRLNPEKRSHEKILKGAKI